MPPRIAVFMGTRPEAIKMAPVVAQLQKSELVEPVVINAGQHREMIQQVIDLFGMSVDAELDVMLPNQSLADLTARLVERIDRVLEKLRLDAVLVQGDTTTVFCAALASFYRRIPIGHVEAGLRTGNLYSPFPEEANRRLTSPLVRWHFSPTERARQALVTEGIDPESILVTGNTVIDALLMELQRQESPEVGDLMQAKLTALLGNEWQESEFVLITGHRRENFGGGFEQICSALAQLAERFAEMQFVYPVHLNPNVRDIVHERLGSAKNIRLIEPQPYAEFVALASKCRLLLTDSGGVQEEAPTLGKPVLVMRDTTERPEGIEAGGVKLVGANTERIVAETTNLLTNEANYQAMANVANPYGDGQAAQRIVAHLEEFFG